MTIMKPIGKAAMMDTVCRLAMEFSAKIRAMGSSISSMARTALPACEALPQRPGTDREYELATMVRASKEVA